MTSQEIRQRMNELLGKSEPVGRLTDDEINKQRDEILGRSDDDRLKIELGEQPC